MKRMVITSSLADGGRAMERFLAVATDVFEGFPRGVIIVALAGLFTSACSERDAADATGRAAFREIIDEMLDREGVVRLPEGQE